VNAIFTRLDLVYNYIGLFYKLTSGTDDDVIWIGIIPANFYERSPLFF